MQELVTLDKTSSSATDELVPFKSSHKAIASYFRNAWIAFKPIPRSPPWGEARGGVKFFILCKYILDVFALDRSVDD
jgi:hypothetical protein